MGDNDLHFELLATIARVFLCERVYGRDAPQLRVGAHVHPHRRLQCCVRKQRKLSRVRSERVTLLPYEPIPEVKPARQVAVEVEIRVSVDSAGEKLEGEGARYECTRARLEGAKGEWVGEEAAEGSVDIVGTGQVRLHVLVGAEAGR